MTSDQFFITIFILIILVMIWRIIAIEITAYQTMKILDHNRKYIEMDLHEFWKYDADYRSVTFNQHLNAVFWFRNPWKLYRYGEEYRKADCC